MEFLASMPPEVLFYGKFLVVIVFIIVLAVVSFFAMFG